MIELFEVLSLINSPGIQSAILPLKILIGGVGIGFLLFIIFALYKSTWLKMRYLFDFTEFFTYRPYGLARKTKMWKQIRARLETANESEYKLAIIEADTMLEEMLKRMGIRGTNVEEYLQDLTPAVVPNLNDLSQAHKTRDNIVHDPSYRLSLGEAKKVLDTYEAVFQNLDFI